MVRRPPDQRRPGTIGVTFPLGPLGITVFIQRWAVGGAVGVRKKLRRRRPEP